MHPIDISLSLMKTKLDDDKRSDSLYHLDMSLSALQPHSPLFTFLYSSSTWSTVVFVFLYVSVIDLHLVHYYYCIFISVIDEDYDLLDLDLVQQFVCICVFVIDDGLIK